LGNFGRSKNAALQDFQDWVFCHAVKIEDNIGSYDRGVEIRGFVELELADVEDRVEAT
jgi:hypothetical protein